MSQINDNILTRAAERLLKEEVARIIEEKAVEIIKEATDALIKTLGPTLTARMYHNQDRFADEVIFRIEDRRTKDGGMGTNIRGEPMDSRT